MTNSLYDKGREKFLRGEISWTDPNTNIKVLLVGKESTSSALGYQPKLATDNVVSDIEVQYRIAISGSLQNRQANAGIASADNIVISEVPQNKIIKYIVIFKDTGNVTTSPLIAFIDTAGGLNPQSGISTDTGNIQIQWDTGPNKIFKL